MCSCFAFLNGGCAKKQTPLPPLAEIYIPVEANMTKIVKAKWQGNHAATLKDEKRELLEYRKLYPPTM
ncbi:MAG: hypothetical protein EAY72_06100 [Bacteroidetes bacterium]|nr:MAG: hypothetical protein EAY72_06100 [Bacteroidota bacterium]